MKKLITAALALALIASVTPAEAAKKKKSKRKARPAASASGPSKAIYANPLGLAFGLFNLGYEQVIGRTNSTFTVGGQFASYGLGGYTYTLLGAGGAYRFRGKSSLDGWFAGPTASVLSVGIKYDGVLAGATADVSGTLFGIGGEGGYQWVFNNGFLVGLGGGINYYLGSVSAGASSSGTTVSGGASFGGTWPSGFVNLGYAF